MGNQPAQHAPASAHPSDQASTTASAPVVAPAPGQVDALVASTTATRAPGLAVALSMDLGDPLIGTRNSHDLFAFNIDPIMHANLWVRFEGHASIMLTEAPETLWTSIENNTKPIKLLFAPTSDAPVAATAIILANWLMNARPAEEHRVQITGAGRYAFAPTRQQKVEAAAAAQAAAAVDEAQRADRQATEQSIDAYYDRPVLGGHEGHRAKLDHKQALLRGAMLNVGEIRIVGIDLAKASIESFQRVTPVPARPSLLESLAWTALDAATGKLASSVASVVKGLASKESPAGAVLGHVGDGVKGMLQKQGKATLASLKEERTPADPHTQSGLGSLASGMFCALQQESFVQDRHTVAEMHARFVADSLLPSLDQDPKGAMAVMDATIHGYLEASQKAKDMQSEATQLSWVRYVAQASMGAERGPDGATTSDMTTANQVPGTQRPVDTFDGLVDLRFGINFAKPQAQATLLSARIRGVSSSVARLIALTPLRQSVVPIAVRAVAIPSNGNMAVVPLTIMRDEAGKIAFTDDLHGVGGPASWLSRKAGVMRPNAESQHEGARILIEDELMSTALGKSLKTDSVS